MSQDVCSVKTEYKSPCVMLLGGFDGLHVGHKKLIDCAKKYNLPIGITTIEGGKGKSLFTLEERRKIFAQHGVNFVHPFTFTEEFKNTSKEEFLNILLNRFCVKAFICGEDFRFGKGAQGTPDFIEEFTLVRVHAMDVLSFRGKKVGTSDVKEYLQKGQIERANELLLTPFFISGSVEEGRKLGRTIGFPTANLSAQDCPLKEGVYAVHATIDEKTYYGIANFGTCPTFDVAYKKLEVCFDGLNQNLYGKEINVYFDGYLRDICRFENAQALTVQLEQDMQKAKKFFLEEKR